MRKAFSEYQALRIYQRTPTHDILNLMMCSKLMKVKPLVRNASLLYKMSCRYLSPRATDFLINQTFCKILTAGNSLEDVEKVAMNFQKDDISVIADYCAQGEIGEGTNEVNNDENAVHFANSAELFHSKKNEMVSIKITGLIKMPLLLTLNNSVVSRDNFWAKHSKNGILTGQQAFNGLQAMYDGLTDDQFAEYLSKIHGYSGDPKQFQIDETGFKMNHYPYYLYDESKNENMVIKLFMPVDASQSRSLHNLKMRLDKICQPFANNTNGFKILVDAEQSYVQKAIEVVIEQLTQKYNQEKLFILPTLQNYLKCSVSRAKYEVQVAKRRNLVFGAKLVRGAYLVEETKLARTNGTENPIVDCFQDTTTNYLQSFRIMAQSFNTGEIVVASHNKDTIYDTAAIARQTGTQMRLSYAQLLGLADHLSHHLKKEGFRVYKLLPWASTRVMIPYMIRRAEQLSQMNYPLDIQYSLLKHELKQRYIY